MSCSFPFLAHSLSRVLPPSFQTLLTVSRLTFRLFPFLPRITYSIHDSPSLFIPFARKQELLGLAEGKARKSLSLQSSSSSSTRVASFPPKLTFPLGSNQQTPPTRRRRISLRLIGLRAVDRRLLLGREIKVLERRVSSALFRLDPRELELNSSIREFPFPLRPHRERHHQLCLRSSSRYESL